MELTTSEYLMPRSALIGDFPRTLLSLVEKENDACHSECSRDVSNSDKLAGQELNDEAGAAVSANGVIFQPMSPE